MTIGPDPMIMMRFKSVRFGMLVNLVFLHLLDELAKQVMRVMRSGRRFRVVLHTEHRFRSMAQALYRLIVQVAVSDFDFRIFERIRIDGETMILRGDFHLAGSAVQDGVIGAMMAEFQFEGLAAKSKPEKVMPQADAEYIRFANQFAQFGGLPFEDARIARPGRKKHAIRPHREDVFRRCIRRNNRDTRTEMHEMPQDVPFNPKIVDDYV